MNPAIGALLVVYVSLGLVITYYAMRVAGRRKK